MELMYCPVQMMLVTLLKVIFFSLSLSRAHTHTHIHHSLVHYRIQIMMLTQRISVLAHDLAKQCHVGRVDEKARTIYKERRSVSLTEANYRDSSKLNYFNFTSEICTSEI